MDLDRNRKIRLSGLPETNAPSIRSVRFFYRPARGFSYQLKEKAAGTGCLFCRRLFQHSFISSLFACIIAVRPRLSVTVTSAWCSSSNFTIPVSPRKAACIRTGSPRLFRIFSPSFYLSPTKIDFCRGEANLLFSKNTRYKIPKNGEYD